MMTLLYLPSLKLLHWFYVPSMILLTYFYILATDEKVKNGHKSWSIRHFDDKSRQSYFDCVSFTRACLKNEMTKQRNGEMTFLKSKNKWLPLFCRVQLLCLCLPWTGKTCSACWCKTSQILLCHRRYRSHLFFLVLRISPLPRDISVLSVSARTAWKGKFKLA